MPSWVYIGAPVQIGIGLLAALSWLHFRLPNRLLNVRTSYALAWVQAAAALLSALATYANPISPFACMLGAYGFVVCAAVAVLDLLNLLWWMVAAVRQGGGGGKGVALGYVLLRVLAHLVFCGAFYWTGALCTV